MVREFKRGEILAKLFSHLVTSPSSPWGRLEIAGSLQDWLEARRDFFPDPRIHHTIEAERQRALGEIAASMRRSPAPFSTRLFTAARHEGFIDEPPPHPDPVSGPVPEGFIDKPPPHPDPVPSSVWRSPKPSLPHTLVPVREGLVDGLPPLPASVPGPVLEGSEDELPPSLDPVLEEFVDELSPLPVSVPEGCEDAPSPPAVPQRFLPLCRRPADRRICRGQPPGRLPVLWVCRTRPPCLPPELFPSFQGHLRPPWSDVCFVGVWDPPLKGGAVSYLLVFL
ncbi:hypothetical protein CRENBAI_011549 [Crenichthys baileyi]|uniref:Uncharacterized protein n=1 Tax=Crenichthys baileyi TaxID=28760 RepID=A0AAV9SLS0_9TELE